MTAACHEITFGGERLSFTIERTSRRKTVSISVGYEGIRVLAPLDMDAPHILQIVRKRGPWVLRKQAAYRELGDIPAEREFVSGETFHYLGRSYRLRVMADPDTVTAKITARGSTLVALVPPNTEPLIQRAAIRSGLRRWYQEHAKCHFPERIRRMAEALGAKQPIVRIVDQSKRWGSCDSQGRIRLNWRLIMAPMNLVDYVIAHEVCHLVEHNHSRRFWRSLETLMPDYESRVRDLDRRAFTFLW